LGNLPSIRNTEKLTQEEASISFFFGSFKLNRLLLIGFLIGCTQANGATDCAQVTEIPLTECQALLDLYQSTDGPSWVENWGWNKTNTPCSWYDVTCEGGHVTKLSLVGNELHGPIPDTLGQLNNLTELELWNNKINGPIPEALGQLSNLISLNLMNNQLSVIPETLGQLSNLEYLSLAQNQLRGPIPETLGQLSNLEYLSLGQNQLSGSIPETLGQLSNLKSLSLGQNQLSGPIPETLGQLSNLTSFFLGDNQLRGPIPETLGQLSNLEYLSLCQNQLSGPIPETLGQLSNLESLHLSNNQLNGQIPNTLGQLSKLEFLSLDHNQLSLNDPIPEALKQLNNLTSLGLSGKFSSLIPEWLEQLSKLTSLYLNNNQFGDPIPEWLGQLSNLTRLVLTGNFSGPIPENLGQLSNLEYLDLHDNQLSGPIPDTLGQLSNLEHLDLHDNQLSGPIPDTLGQLSNLNYLFLENNQLCGTIPSTFTSLQQLYHCNISNKFLTTTDPNLIQFLDQKCLGWTNQNPPVTNCTTNLQRHTLTLQTDSNGTVTAPIGLNDGINCEPDCSEEYFSNSNITLTAQANPDFHFYQWEGDCSGAQPSITISVTNDLTCRATFEAGAQAVMEHTLTVEKKGAGEGSLTLIVGNQPSTTCEPTCKQTAAHQTPITITAQPAEQTNFIGLFGTGCAPTLFLVEDLTCQARFEPLSQSTLTVVASGAGQGQIRSLSGDIDCRSQCQHSYLAGDFVTLQAIPDAQSSFLGWSDNCHSWTDTTTLTLQQDLTCEAYFDKGGIPRLAVTPNPVYFAQTPTVSKRTVTVSNQGDGELQLNQFTLVGSAAFQIREDNCSQARLIPEGTCTVTLELTPSDATSYQAQLMMPSNDLQALQALSLQGQGCQTAETSEPTTVFQPYQLDFGTEAVGNQTVRSQRIDVWSTDCQSAEIDQVTLSGTHHEEFTVAEPDCYYGIWEDQAYASCWLEMIFQPIAAGIKEVQPVVTYTVPELPTPTPNYWSAAAISEGMPQLELSATEYDFGSWTLGQEPPATWNLVVTNSGESNLTIDAVRVSGKFKAHDNCNWLAPAQTCQVRVQFTPTAPGDHLGELSLDYAGTTAVIPYRAR
jgi:Leucine-rich repeat (LRR) protein